MKSKYDLTIDPVEQESLEIQQSIEHIESATMALCRRFGWTDGLSFEPIVRYTPPVVRGITIVMRPSSTGYTFKITAVDSHTWRIESHNYSISLSGGGTDVLLKHIFALAMSFEVAAVTGVE